MLGLKDLRLFVGVDDHDCSELEVACGDVGMHVSYVIARGAFGDVFSSGSQSRIAKFGSKSMGGEPIVFIVFKRCLEDYVVKCYMRTTYKKSLVYVFLIFNWLGSVNYTLEIIRMKCEMSG